MFSREIQYAQQIARSARGFISILVLHRDFQSLFSDLDLTRVQVRFTLYNSIIGPVISTYAAIGTISALILCHRQNCISQSSRFFSITAESPAHHFVVLPQADHRPLIRALPNTFEEYLQIRLLRCSMLCAVSCILEPTPVTANPMKCILHISPPEILQIVCVSLQRPVCQEVSVIRQLVFLFRGSHIVDILTRLT